MDYKAIKYNILKNAVNITIDHCHNYLRLPVTFSRYLVYNINIMFDEFYVGYKSRPYNVAPPPPDLPRKDIKFSTIYYNTV